MLPFLKNKQEASMSEGDEPEESSFGTLDAVCEDMLQAFQSKDKSLLKQALEALCEYLRSEDEAQDQSLTNKE